MSLKIDKSVKNFLLDFGLTEKEITVYTTLLKTGPNTIMNLARETGIKRSTTHNTVEELIKKGLVSQTNYGERRMVIAEDPDKLKFLMEQKKWDINKLEKNLPEAINSIYGFIPSAREHSKANVKYYDGKEGASLIYKDAFNSVELRSYVNLGAFYKYFPENSEFYINAQKKNRSLKVKEIIDGSDESKKIAETFTQHSNFEFKTMSETMNLSAIDILLYDGKSAFINFGDNITGTVIENTDYYSSSIAIFDFIWSCIK